MGRHHTFLFQKVKRVIGVELCPEAVEDARVNAQDNGEWQGRGWGWDRGSRHPCCKRQPQPGLEGYPTGRASEQALWLGVPQGWPCWEGMRPSDRPPCHLFRVE